MPNSAQSSTPTIQPCRGRQGRPCLPTPPSRSCGQTPSESRLRTCVKPKSALGHIPTHAPTVNVNTATSKLHSPHFYPNMVKHPPDSHVTSPPTSPDSVKGLHRRRCRSHLRCLSYDKTTQHTLGHRVSTQISNTHTPTPDSHLHSVRSNLCRVVA